jgi:hypothetical protein
VKIRFGTKTAVGATIRFWIITTAGDVGGTGFTTVKVLRGGIDGACGASGPEGCATAVSNPERCASESVGLKAHTKPASVQMTPVLIFITTFYPTAVRRSTLGLSIGLVAAVLSSPIIHIK